jgi:hypothetical protein
MYVGVTKVPRCVSSSGKVTRILDASSTVPVASGRRSWDMSTKTVLPTTVMGHRRSPTSVQVPPASNGSADAAPSAGPAAAGPAAPVAAVSAGPVSATGAGNLPRRPRPVLASLIVRPLPGGRRAAADPVAANTVNRHAEATLTRC